MLQQGLDACLLLNVEAELDCSNGALALQALRAAGTVIAITAYRTAAMEDYADILLPMALYAENEGSYYNLEGARQAFAAVVPAPGEARPAWKILRMLADAAGVDGCRFDSAAAIDAELQPLLAGVTPDNHRQWAQPAALPAANGSLQRITSVPLYAGDPLVRRAGALQDTGRGMDGSAYINEALAQQLGVEQGGRVRLQQDQAEAILPVVIDAQVPAGAVLVHGGHPDTGRLGAWFGDITLSRA